ncbi:MAG: ATP-binding response regulator, partial [Betaproteobacteria bacterium]
TDASRRQAPGGLGVGLALSRQIVELHGGSIEVRSEGPGRGGEFVVGLPRAAAAARTSAPEPQRRRASVPRRVLVSDDNADAAAMLEAVLGQMGHAVRVAHDGEAALRLALAEPPDVILLDLGMPKQDGYEVAARLRQDARFDAVPLIAVTGYAQEIDRSKARSAGFDEHLVKPVDPDLLCAALETVRWKKESISS